MPWPQTVVRVWSAKRKTQRLIVCNIFRWFSRRLVKLCGQPTRSGWGRSRGFARLLGDTDGRNCLLSEAYGRKRRPDRSDCRSFPSGHSAWAFAGATVIAREFGWRSAWYPVGAYAFAAGIAIERIAVRPPLGVGCGRRSTYRGGYDRAGLFSRRPHLWRARTE